MLTRLFILLTIVPFLGVSQYNYIDFQDTKISHLGQNEYKFPWAGGLNGVQYGGIDLNNDGFEDLVGFDRSSGRLICFLKNGASYQYAPAYESFFPDDIFNFFILKDYNQDGKADLFTAGPLGIKVYKNISSGNLPQWEKSIDFITYESLSANEVNLQLSFNDYPHIADLDGDGDLDILNFNFSGIQSRILYYENRSIEETGTADIAPFKLIDNYWGEVEDCDCGVFAFSGDSCQDTLGRLLSNARHAGGKSVSVFDFNGDGRLDLVSSHEECNELYFFSNKQSAGLSPLFDEFTTDFPNAQNPASFNFYPNTMVMDVIGNDEEELIISPNVESILGSPVDFSQSNWLYQKNNGQYELITKQFLQEDMLDWGVQASPAFLDFDEDGDLDLFIGYTDLNDQGDLFSAIAHYNNVGDPNNPAFDLVTDDFMNVSDLGLANILIQWVDVDLDGRKDLSIQGTFENTNQLLIAFQDQSGFNKDNLIEIQDVFIGFGYSVHFADVSGNNLPDLLVGKSSGGLILYENIGSDQAPAFQLVENTFLDIGDDFFRSALRVHTADLNNDGTLDLITSDLSGTFRIYGDIENNIENFDTLALYNSIIQSFESGFFGKRNNLVTANLYHDDYPAIVMGTVSGGIRILRNNAEFPVSNGDELVFQVYPNPNTSRQLSIKTNQDILLSITTLNGQKVMENIAITAFSNQTIQINSFEKGIYAVTALFQNGEQRTRKLVVF